MAPVTRTLQAASDGPEAPTSKPRPSTTSSTQAAAGAGTKTPRRKKA